MPLRKEVQEAFDTLGLTQEAPFADAAKAYKRLALLHHPDRNHADPGATHRFQEIGHAWDICQKYYENPAWGEGGRFQPDDDDFDLDEDDLQYYMFMFAESLFNRFNRASGQRYRFEHRAGRNFFTFTPTSSGSFGSYDDKYSQERHEENVARQKREKEKIEQQRRELEREIEEEEREAQEKAKKQKADEDRLASLHDRAFKAAYDGNAELVKSLIKEHNLDITAPRNLRNAKNVRKQDDAQYETLLHAAATRCDESLFMFLIEKGANPNMLNKHQLTPFHAAIRAGNSNIVRFILDHRGKSFQYHPSKATPSGVTPLQLAIESGDRDTIDLLLKHATTHDVERCWKHLEISEQVKDILRTKKGFVPPGEGLPNAAPAALSKKAQRQQELAQQKEARIAEELRRAEINRQKKEERAARRIIMEQEKAEREEEERQRRQAEEQERQRLEDLRRAQEEEEASRAKDLEEAKLKAEAEAAAKLEKAKARAAAAEAKKLALQLEREQKAEKLRLEKERQDKERIERQQAEEKERLAKEQAEQEEAERRLQAEAARLREEEAKIQAAQPVAPKKHGRVALTEEERTEIRRERQREKQREKRRAKAVERLEGQKAAASPTITAPHQPSEHSETPVSASSTLPKATTTKETPTSVDAGHMDERQQKKHEQIMRRRAEQSARDKERHRRLVEERKKARLESQAQNDQNEYVPLTPVSTHTTRQHGFESLSRNSPVPAPQSTIATPAFSAFAGPEDVQTCVVPDDLFRPERPPKPNVVNQTAESVPSADGVPTSATEPASVHRRKFFKFPRRKTPMHGNAA